MSPLCIACLALGACDPGTADSGANGEEKADKKEEGKAPKKKEEAKENADSSKGAKDEGGVPSGGGTGEVNSPHCERIEKELDDLDQKIGDRTLKEIIEASTGSFDGVWSSLWKKDKRPLVKIEPDCDGEVGQLSVGYEKGKVLFVESKFVDCTPGADCEDIGVICMDQFEVVVDVGLLSENKALDESWTGRLVIDDPRDPDFEEEQMDKDPEERGPMIYVERDKVEFEGEAKFEASSEGDTVVRQTMDMDIRIVDGKLKSAVIEAQVELDSNDGETSSMAVVDLFRFKAQDLVR